MKLPFCRIKDITPVNKTSHISAKTKNYNFSRSNSNFSILTPTFSRDGFYESCFQNPSENSVISPGKKTLTMTTLSNYSSAL